MKKARLILSASMLALAALTSVTMTSCDSTKDCLVGYSGSNCKTEVRDGYVGTYKGNGTDNDGGTYTNFGLDFSKLGTDVTKMHATLKDNNDAAITAFDITLQSNTTFSVVAYTSDGFSYTGNGTIDGTTATLSLSETENSTTTTTVYTFNNMIKQ